MSTLADAILKEIAQTEPSEDGYLRIPSSSYHQIKGKSVFMHSTEDLCALIADSRIPWERVLVTDPHHSTSTRSLLATAIEHWDFHGHLDYDERVIAALLLRFEPVELCTYLAHSKPFPISETLIGGGLDQRHCFLERLGLMVASDSGLIDTWVDLFFLELKYREKMFANSFFEGAGNVLNVTTRYRKLDLAMRGSHVSMLALVSVMVMAAAFSSEEVKRSMRRYSTASLFELTEGSLTGFVMEDSNPGRNAFIHALYLLGAHANEGFIQTHVTRKAIAQGARQLGPALLAVLVSSEKPAFSLQTLIGKGDGVDEDLLKRFMSDYLFRWRHDLSSEALHQKRNAPLRKALRQPAMISHMFSEGVFSRCHTKADIDGVKVQFESLPADMREALLISVLDKVKWQMKRRDPYGLRGMTMFLLAVGGQVESLSKLFAPKLPSLLKSADGMGMSHLEFESTLKLLYTNGVIALRAFAQAVPDRSFIEKLIEMLNVSRDEVVSNLKPRMAEEVIVEDLGL